MPITKRTGKRTVRWIFDYRDELRKRRYITCKSEEEALEAQARIDEQLQAGPNLRLETLAECWLEIQGPRVRPATLKVYRKTLQLYILPDFGKAAVGTIRPRAIEALLARKLAVLAPASVSRIRSVFGAVLDVAVRDERIRSNPVRSVRGPRMRPRWEEKVVFTPDELKKVLAASETVGSSFGVLILTLARTGMRIGEALALRWRDVDLERQRILIERAVDAYGNVGPTKNGRPRPVDVSAGLRARLERERVRFLEASLKRGTLCEDFVFRGDRGPFKYHQVNRPFHAMLEAAGLPVLRLHGLRHTFASIHLANGAPVTYVKEQLGHASIRLTVDTYGRWLSGSNLDLANRLDD